MFEVMFEVHPQESQWDAYLTIAKGLKPILESTRGFVENVRYKSITRPGWLLSLSDWEDEKALVRWRTNMKHHGAQEKGRNQVFHDYHLRIGEVFEDSHGDSKKQIRLDETERGEAKVITLMNAGIEGVKEGGQRNEDEVLKIFGLDPADSNHGLVAWDIFEAILTPGKYLLFCCWKDQEQATTTSSRFASQRVERTRYVRVIRDYGMFDREEAPQYYPEVQKPSNRS